VKRAAAFMAVAHFVGFESFTTALLELTLQALCCRAAPQAQIEAVKTCSKTNGMSGSPLWLLMEKGEKGSGMKPLAIVRVFIAYDGPRRALKSTDIGEALKLLHELLASVRTAKK
jgi:hypothetical protein